MHLEQNLETLLIQRSSSVPPAFTATTELIYLLTKAKMD